MDFQTVQAVWAKATIVPGADPTQWRTDACGAWIGYQFYGRRDSQYGWEIDHITARANGGQDVVSNYRPLQWQNNAGKQDGRLVKIVTASGANNIKVA